MKKRYQATIYILQKADKQIYYRRVFRFEWAAMVMCMITMYGIQDLVQHGVFDVHTEILPV